MSEREGHGGGCGSGLFLGPRVNAELGQVQHIAVCNGLVIRLRPDTESDSGRFVCSSGEMRDFANYRSNGRRWKPHQVYEYSQRLILSCYWCRYSNELSC